MIKVSSFRGVDSFGPRVIPLFGAADSVFEKTAAASLLAPVTKYIESLRPSNNSIYVLVNAMGASEYYGSNINGDAFTEACLLHMPDDWRDDPALDKVKGKSWHYGFPTFYGAHPFAHHRNKDPSRAFGEVELAAWNKHMHRVELVCRIDKDKCEQFGGVPVWDRIRAGQFPDVSMGCFTKGTQVTMADGTRKPIEQVQVGDMVLTHLGNSRKVTETHRREYSGPLYRIRAEAHETITATRQHPFWCVPEEQVKDRGRWKEEVTLRPSWVEAQDLGEHFLLEPMASIGDGQVDPSCRVVDGYAVTPIRSIEAEESVVDVYNLEVEGDASYLVAGLAVHNCKVPFDTCSICLDKKVYQDAHETYDKTKHDHLGHAVLEFHKKLKEKNGVGIRGLSITRKDYCEHASKQMNKILKDGRKVWVFNDFPRFFDISFVFIGADKTAKMMLKIADAGTVYSIPSAKVAEDLGYMELWHPESTTREHMEKSAEIGDTSLKVAFLGKSAKLKRGEIIKDIVPDGQGDKVVPLNTTEEKELPKELLDIISQSNPLEEILSTLGGLGTVLRPREFQRVILVQVGKKGLADDLERNHVVFPKSDDEESVPMGPGFFSKTLARFLAPLLGCRSAFRPTVRGRIVISITKKEEEKDGKTKISSQNSALLNKIGSTYNGYRRALMDQVLFSQPLLSGVADLSTDFQKAASMSQEDRANSVRAYFQNAFWNEVSVSGNGLR